MQKDHNNDNKNDITCPHKNDVLSGRGVSIANHPGNLRFRTLVTTYIDDSYCFSFTSSEKKAIALDIVNHISKLDPPGRFLKRFISKPKGLEGPWFIMDEREIIKKTCQALRDCNRLDRSGYALGVREPEDVKHLKAQAKKEGLTVKDRAKAAIKKNIVHNRDEEKRSKAKLNGTICSAEVGRGKVLMKRENSDGEHASPPHKNIATASSNPYPTRYATASRMDRSYAGSRNEPSLSYGAKVEVIHRNNHHHDYFPSTINGNGIPPYDTPPPAPPHHQQQPHYSSSIAYYDNCYEHHASYASHFSPVRMSHDHSVMSLHPASKMNVEQSNFNLPSDYSLHYYNNHNRSSDPLQPVKKQRTEYRESHSSTIVSKSTSTLSPPTPLVKTDNKKSFDELEEQFFPESSSTDYNGIDDEYLLTNMDFDSHELTDALNLF
jgi:hypothetical protein